MCREITAIPGFIEARVRPTYVLASPRQSPLIALYPKFQPGALNNAGPFLAEVMAIRESERFVDTLAGPRYAHHYCMEIPGKTMAVPNFPKTGRASRRDTNQRERYRRLRRRFPLASRDKSVGASQDRGGRLNCLARSIWPKNGAAGRQTDRSAKPNWWSFPWLLWVNTSPEFWTAELWR